MSENTFHSKAEILAEIEAAERVMYRYRSNPRTQDRANMIEHDIDELREIAENMKNDQLADCDHLFNVT